MAGADGKQRGQHDEWRQQEARGEDQRSAGDTHESEVSRAGGLGASELFVTREVGSRLTPSPALGV